MLPLNDYVILTPVKRDSRMDIPDDEERYVGDVKACPSPSCVLVGARVAYDVKKAVRTKHGNDEFICVPQEALLYILSPDTDE